MIPDAYKISFNEEPCVWSVKFLHNIYLRLKHVFFGKIILILKSVFTIVVSENALINGNGL